jgi:hypothetical protein
MSTSLRTMKKIYDLAVKTGTYTSNGETKNRYLTVGSCMENDDGAMFLFLNKAFNPAGIESKEGSDSIIVSMFTPKPKDGGKATPF